MAEPELEARIARWRAIARAAAQHEEVSERWLRALRARGDVMFGSSLYDEMLRVKNQLSTAVDALSEEERAELKEGS